MNYFVFPGEFNERSADSVSEGSFGKADPGQEGFIPFVSPDGVPARVQFEPNEPVGAVIDCFVQPFIGLANIVEAGVYQRDPIRRHVLGTGHVH